MSCFSLHYLSFLLFRVQSYDFFFNFAQEISIIFYSIEKNMGKFVQEFKEFAVKGNAIDMAVGVIIGGAFGKIVTSIVNDIIMPPIGWIIGGVNFSDLKVTLPKEVIGGVELAPATINYGNFIQTIIDFTIIAFCVFMLVKGINSLKRKKNEAPAEPAKEPEPSNEEKLLAEIRDLLEKQ